MWFQSDKGSLSYKGVKIAFSFFLLLYSQCGTPASWATRHTTVCLDKTMGLLKETTVVEQLAELLQQFKVNKVGKRPFQTFKKDVSVGCRISVYFLKATLTLANVSTNKQTECPSLQKEYNGRIYRKQMEPTGMVSEIP